MSLPTPSSKKFGLLKLLAKSNMISPARSAHLQPLVLGGGGQGSSAVPTQQLYLSDVVLDHLHRVFDNLCAGESMLSRDNFAAFLSTVQLQTVQCPLDKDRYGFEDFLEAVWYNHGFEIMKECKPEDKDLTKPISNYYISSSHNTYLSGNQLSSKSSTEAYKNVLTRGCRCIEIDVWNGETADSKSDQASIRSTSPNGMRPGHTRHLSGSTLSSKAGQMVEKAEEKYEKAKQMLADRTRASNETLRKTMSTPDSTSTLSVTDTTEKPPSIRSLRLGEPFVMHGWTLTTPVGFRDVCKSIRETAFLDSNLPIIVSLEVHADLEQQEIMVDIMKEEWKDFLIDQADEACNPDERLPRLEELLNKILVKVKHASSAKRNSLAPIPTRDQGDSGQSGSEDERGKPKKKKAKICESLSNLGIYTQSEHFVNFDAPSAKRPPHVFSVGETQILELHETMKEEMFAHNRRFFMRAYPAGFRIDSSNPDPSVLWRKGVQMVALNWQTWDEGMMLNEGMFASEQGWVLKPPGYRSQDPTADQSDLIEHKTLNLRVTIYAGQKIPIPPNQTERGFRPYIKCVLHVEQQEERTGKPTEGEFKQKTSYLKGDHPDLGPEGVVLSFQGIPKVVEGLSFVRFKVEDAKYAKDSLAAWACIRLDRLQQGYRFINLFDAKGHATSGMLLVKIEKTVS